MDSWEIVKLSPGNKETGTISEATSLWDIQTVAAVLSNRPTEIKKSPAISSSIENGHICIALDSSVISLEDAYQPQGIIQSESLVDCLAMSHDASFLFIGMNDGNISMIQLPRNKCILKRSLVEVKEKNDHIPVFKNIFFIKNSENDTSEVLILSAHTLFHFINIQLERIRCACEDSNSEVQNILAEIVNYEISFASNGGCVFTNFGCCNFLLMWDEENVNLFSLEGHEIIHSTSKAALKGAAVKKAKICTNGHVVFLLDKLKVMHIMCLRTFLAIDTFNDLKMDDFTLIESLENSSFTTFDTKVLVLTGFKTSSCALCLYQFPGFQLIYSIDVCPDSYIIDMPPNYDSILFFEGCKANDNSEIVTALKVRKITEASCEAQLSRLLNKRLFEEALLFASKFNINSQVIFITKANYLLENLSRKDNSPQNIAAMKVDLYSSLDKINDAQHVIRFCVNSAMCSLSDTLEMLLYAKLKLGTSVITDDDLCIQVFQTLKKLETFRLIHNESQFSSSWDGFMRANLWDELLRYLFHKKLDVASLLWEQYVENFLQSMTKANVIQFLNSIPEALISDTLCHWLRNSVLPAILSRVQDSLESVAAWVIQCASTLELTDKTGWPINAINFAQMFLDVCQDISSNATFCGIRIDIDVALQIGKSIQNANESLLPKLHQLLNNLHDLKELRQTYNCKISLAEYSLENKQAVVFRLLEWVNGPDEIPKFVKDFLKPYTGRNCLNIDDVILHYIMEVMEYTEFNWWLCEEPPWEKQIIALIHCMEDEEFYLNAICKMLQTIPVPWSQNVHNMVNRSLKLKNPLVESIKLEIDNIGEKTVLMKYGFQRINLSDIEVAEIVMRRIMVKCIDNATAMQDALVIAKNAKFSITEAYIFRMKHLIQSERLSDCLSLLKSLPRDIAVPCCKRLAFFACELDLSMGENERSSLSDYLFMKLGIYALYHLKSLISSFDFENYADLLQNLESSLAFQQYFGVYLNIENLHAENICVHIFESNVESFLTCQELNLNQGNKLTRSNVENERRLYKGKPMFQHLFQIASLLNLKRVTALEIIAKKAFMLDKYDLCTDICGELCYPSLTGVNGNALLGLLCFIFNEWCKKTIPSGYIQPLLNVLDNLLASATVVCEPDLLESCAYLSTWMFLLKTVRYKSRRENLDFTNIIALSGADPYCEWTYSTIFKETALRVDLEKLLPHLRVCIQSIFHEGNSLCGNHNSLSKTIIASLTDLIQQLKLNGQLLLAHAVYVGSIPMFLNTVNKTSEYSEIFSNATMEKQKLTANILKNAFGQSRLDYSLLLGLLLNLPKAEAISTLQAVENRSGYDYRRLQHIAIVGEEFSQNWDETQLAAYYRMLQKESEWGRKFSQLHINFKGAFRGNAFEKIKLVHHIANQPQITLPAIHQYCSAFNLDLDEALLITLDVFLTSVYNKLPDSVTMQQVAKSQSQALNNCSQVIREIKNKKLVFEKLNIIYVKTDPYNYEILEFILESMTNIALFETDTDAENAEKGLILLRFLKRYKRISEPSEFEIELWLENSEFSKQNEKIKERLPYHSLLVPTDAVKILVSELTATTVDVWLKIANCLKLHKNEIIMMTVENLVRQIVPKLGASLALQQTWVVMVPNKQLLYIICNLISRIDDLEKATACATSVVKRLPPSYCKVYATMGAISFAKNWWEATQSKKAEHAMNLLRKLHSSMYTDQILYEHGLHEAHYSSLSEQPEELICQLYEHPSIEQRYWLDSNKFPDIHGACEKIAGVTQSDLDSLRLSLLTKWIFPTEYLSGGLDETIIENFCVPTFDPKFEDEPTRRDQNFKRSVYLLQNCCIEDNAVDLVNVIESNSPTVSYGHRLNALKCLLHIADMETVKRLTRMDVFELQVLAKAFFCGSQLEQLCVACKFPNIDDPTAAQDLAIQLLQSQSHNSIVNMLYFLDKLPFSRIPIIRDTRDRQVIRKTKCQALTLAADLCFHSELYNLQIWNTILRRMIDSKVYKPLKEVLFLLSSHSIVLQSSEFFKAWSTILKDDTMDKNEPARGFNKLILLHRCPLLHEVDLLSLAEYFNQVSLPVLTIDCFLHLPDHSSRKENIKEYLTTSAIPLVLQHLKELRDVASSLYHLDEITKILFLSIAKKRLCGVVSSSLLLWYEDYIKQNKQLNNLVNYAVQNNMCKECSSLLQKHISLNPESEFVKEVKRQEAEGVNIVKIYCEMNKLDKVQFRTES